VLTDSHCSQSKKVYKIYNLTDEEATLVEPASCAIHGLDKLNAPVGAEALILGAGPTGILCVKINTKFKPHASIGLILAQLLKLNGASKVTIAANKGIKTQVARDLNCADEYIELDRTDPESQWAQLKAASPYGFDVVVGFLFSISRVYPIAYTGRSNWIRKSGQRCDQFRS
jgi:D-arabinitol dehydrogenase (NADP+)